jgi:2-methylcitrate dehydratase
MNDDTVRPRVSALGRRDLMKLGAGVVATAIAGEHTSAQRGGGGFGGVQNAPPPGSMPPADEPRPHTGPGYKNDYNRLAGNGPMDDTTRKIVKFVREFKESDITSSATKALNRTMIDSVAAIVAGFEEDAARAAARVSQWFPGGELKSTVLGYGLSTTPEHAAFANGTLVRCTDYNDNGPGGHTSDLIPAALAVGEAMHSTGAEVAAAIVIGYEISGAPAGGEAVRAAMVAGRLMKLDEDRLANAVGIALIPHVALNKGVGALSMWKGVRSAEATKCGVWSAMLARAGMTGPPQPFEGRGSLWEDQGGSLGRPFTLPLNAQMLGIETTWAKRYPSDAQTQGVLQIIPDILAWTKPDEIASIHYDMTLGNWEEVGSAPKWDPRNRETADHSVPYVVARSLLDGRAIYLDSFKPEKYPNRDPAVKALIDRIVLSPVKGWGGLGTARITIRKKSGETKFFDTYNGSRNPSLEEYRKLMSEQDIVDKFKRACEYKQVAASQRDQALAQWSNIMAVKDIAEPMRTLAKFGKPQPL